MSFSEYYNYSYISIQQYTDFLKYIYVCFCQESGDGVLKYIGDMLRNETQLRCTDIGGCLGQVKAGSSVYVNVNLTTNFDY